MQCGDVLCPLCCGALSVHNCYQRHIVDEQGNWHNGWIAQGKCKPCKHHPSLIPDFILPYKHYEAAVIEAAVSEMEENGNFETNSCPADDSTIRRWFNQFKERGARAVGWLLSILFDLYGKYINALELQNKGFLKQLSRLLREFQTPETGGIFGRVNIILTKYNAGFL